MDLTEIIKQAKKGSQGSLLTAKKYCEKCKQINEYILLNDNMFICPYCDNKINYFDF